MSDRYRRNRKEAITDYSAQYQVSSTEWGTAEKSSSEYSVVWPGIEGNTFQIQTQNVGDAAASFDVLCSCRYIIILNTFLKNSLNQVGIDQSKKEVWIF